MRSILITLLVAACGGSAIGQLRYQNAPAAARVDDRHDIAKPETRVFERAPYMVDIFVAQPVTYSFELRATAPAGDVNALDEVPDSTWFTNRIGVRDVPLDELREAAREDRTDPAGPWTILGTKVGGNSPGLLVRDASGAKFVMKFDTPGAPDMQTGADVVVQKLMWAAGFNTPDDQIITLHREDLVLGPGAKVEDLFGHKHAMTKRDLDKVLEEIDQRSDGSYRALVSRYLDGVPVGGYPREGVREDDPNDRVAHEDRRSVRAQRVFFAWVDHTDVKEDNTLDMWITDGERHYLLHHLVDFGMALGVYGYDQKDPSDGYARTYDFAVQTASLFSLGLWKRPWEANRDTGIRGVGRFESVNFAPLAWRERYPYEPFKHIQNADGFWAAKLIMRFTPEQLRAAAEEGKYEDPRAVDYIARILRERQLATGRAWFARVSPLDNFALAADGGLTFDDLAKVYFPDTPATSYVARAYDYRGDRLPYEANVATANLPAPPVPATNDGYTIVEISAVRANHALPAVRVHIATDPVTHQRRIIGIRRS